MENLTLATIIELAKVHMNVKSDYALGKALGIHFNSLYNYRHGRTFPDERACGILADAAKVDSDVLIARVQALRSRDDDTRATWKRIADRLERSALAAIFAVVFALLSIAPEARAASVSAAQDDPAARFELLYIVLSGLLVLALLFRYIPAPGFPLSFVPQ